MAALMRAFIPAPRAPIWEWADETVWLQNEDAAEPGPYRSAKTIWTRRLQELIRDPFMFTWDETARKWTRVRVNEIDVQKSTQSGFTEAVLNCIRWMAHFLPRNVIYAIDSADEAKKIARRLLRSLKLLDSRIFTGNPDDIKSYEFLLRGMELLFYGSFSSGKFANKQAPIVVADEVEEHGSTGGDTSTLRNLQYRKKTAKGGVQINISKPKLENGPINKAWKRGNQEEFHVPCPHCGHMQWITFSSVEMDSPFSDIIDDILDEQTGEVLARLPRPLPLGQTRKVRTGRLVYEHCRDLLGNWDELKISRETYYECSECKQPIYEGAKEWMTAQGVWRPTALGTPGIVSQHINDLYSSDENSTWGQIVLEFLNAKKEGRKELQGVINNRFGNTWREELNKTEEADIKSNIAGHEGDPCPPYTRGTIPFVPSSLLLGSDVGGNYARWVLIAVMENMVDAAVIDWGDEIDPETIGEIMLNDSWPCIADGKKHRISHGFIDAKYRKAEVQRVCWNVFKTRGHILIPTAGIGGAAARGVRVWAYTPIQGYRHKNFKKLDYNDREAKNDVYIDCLSKKKRRILFPVDVIADPRFIKELCAEELVEDDNGQRNWNPFPDPNHYGDALKDSITGLRFLTRKHHLSRSLESTESDPEKPPVELPS